MTLSAQNKPLAAIYVRVSTEDQAKHGFSLAAQEEALKNYSSALGYEISQIYKDEGKSAKDIKNRPAMNQMLEDAQNKKFSAIFIYKLDRFSRSLKDLILTIDKLKEWGIDFVSLQDKIETTSASGKLMFHIISAFAEFERNIIGERTRFGMERKSKEGGAVTKPPFGYKMVNKKLEVDLERGDLVKEIFEKFLNKDISLNNLSREYGLTVNGLKKILTNRTYLGEVKFDGRSSQGIQKPLVSKEVFEETARKLNRMAYKREFTKFYNLIDKILTQYDPRYLDTHAMKVLAEFMVNKAIICEEREIKSMGEPTEVDLKGIRNLRDPQKIAKYVGFVLLKNEGFSDSEIFFERSFAGGRPDVAGVSKEKEIFVECFSCRVNKIVDYLNDNREVWVLTDGSYPWDKEENKEEYMQWFVFKKGSKWEETYKDHIKSINKELKKIKSPIDGIMG